MQINVFRTATVLPIRAYVMENVASSAGKNIQVCATSPPNATDMSAFTILTQKIGSNVTLMVDDVAQVVSDADAYIETNTTQVAAQTGPTQHTIRQLPTSGQTQGDVIGAFTSFPIANESGWIMISDIDDTVKNTGVLDKTGVVLDTLFNKAPVANPGFSESYARLFQALGQPPLYFVSGSPYPLFNTLNTFLSGLYAMPFELRLKNTPALKDPIGLITNVLSDALAFKQERIGPIVSDAFLPNANWLMIGDSTEKDPEVYASFVPTIAARGKQYCIWIHIVTGFNADKEKVLNAPDRFNQVWAQNNVDTSRVFLFQNASLLGDVDVAGGSCQTAGFNMSTYVSPSG